ncbi:MAG: type II toxin-antitoxin system VapB family antitoxin [Candidatus Eisenbacteria bacterium]
MTLRLDNALLATAARLTGVRNEAAPVRMGLELLVSRARARRLVSLAGTENRLRAPRRRRASPA